MALLLETLPPRYNREGMERGRTWWSMPFLNQQIGVTFIPREAVVDYSIDPRAFQRVNTCVMIWLWLNVMCSN